MVKLIEIAFTINYTVTETSLKVAGLDGKKLNTAEIKEVRLQVNIEIFFLQELSPLTVH